ncbi:glycosyltransferase family 2 protein, partial [bacterium]|nr:glycosyltransferase family 2 protein [bacterium]
MSSSTFLSFCIPSYNRLVRVRELVDSLLSLPDTDIEVIVLDNASTDGTYEQLKKITDPRFKLATNPENRGALFNMVNVFGHASGDYVIYSTDQDKTNVDRLNEFKAFLRAHSEISCGFCEFIVPGGLRHKFFPRGYEAVNAIAYKGRHPTGYFFRNDHLRTVRLAERMADFNVVDLFPLEFSPNNGDDVVNHKSSTTNGASKNAFFAPATRLKLAISYCRHVEQLSLSQGEKSQLLAKLFLSELREATVGYRNVMANERICIHYRT